MRALLLVFALLVVGCGSDSLTGASLDTYLGENIDYTGHWTYRPIDGVVNVSIQAINKGSKDIKDPFQAKVEFWDDGELLASGTKVAPSLRKGGVIDLHIVAIVQVDRTVFASEMQGASFVVRFTSF